MSLVAYATSSDDESDNQNEQETIDNRADIKSVEYISDEDIFDTPISQKQSRGGLNLPVPKNREKLKDSYPLFEVLPPPKVESENESVLIEEDDEYLHKKATPIEIAKQALPPPARNLVQITIPSLKDFDELDEQKDKKISTCKKPSKFSNLISILPRPKSEQIFVKAKDDSSPQENSKQSAAKPSLVPDAVKIRRPAQNTENVERTKQRKIASRPKAKPLLVNVSDSEGSDLEGDFFSLTNDNNLPEVSTYEISAMVSKKAMEMAQASSKFASIVDANRLDDVAEDIKKFSEEDETKTQQQLDQAAIQALVGSQAKRRKMNDVEVIDISSEQVLPNREDWLRTALASATTYQPTGVLTDEEPAAGTRRKHQITYLAHKAKANEAELQAMWSANRQNRRQTQSKYGF